MGWKLRGESRKWGGGEGGKRAFWRDMSGRTEGEGEQAEESLTMKSIIEMQSCIVVISDYYWELCNVRGHYGNYKQMNMNKS